MVVGLFDITVVNVAAAVNFLTVGLFALFLQIHYRVEEDVAWWRPKLVMTLKSTKFIDVYYVMQYASENFHMVPAAEPPPDKHNHLAKILLIIICGQTMKNIAR